MFSAIALISKQHLPEWVPGSGWVLMNAIHQTNSQPYREIKHDLYATSPWTANSTNVSPIISNRNLTAIHAR